MDRHSLPAVGRHAVVVHAVGTHSLPAVGRNKKNVTRYLVHGMILYFEHGPHRHVPTNVAAPSSTNNCERLSTHQDEKVSCVCVRAQIPWGLDLFGGVCVERGGEKWAKKRLNHTHQPINTHI